MKKIEIKYEYLGKGKSINVIAINGEDITETYKDSLFYGIGLWFESFQDMKENILEELEENEKTSKLVFKKV